MDYVFFTKTLKDYTVPRLIEALEAMGADGADLAVRPGYAVNPENARKELPRAVEALRKAGLSAPMVTAATDLTDPVAAEDLVHACHDAGVLNLKLGYWVFRGGDYWKQVDAARKQLEGFADLAGRFGVKACLHTHSGPYLTVNTAALMHLARGFDPNLIGAYLDPGHLALTGEPLPLAFAMAADYLSLVAIKDSKWAPGDKGQPRKDVFLPVGKGFVDWRGMMRELLARNYAGPLSFHSEFEAPTTEYLLAQTKKDIAYLRRIEAEARKGMA